MTSIRQRLVAPGSRSRRILIGLAVYALCTSVFFATAARDRILEHTPYNHYALLADCWLHGRLEMEGPPPPYAQNNDFALYKDRWYVSFPPFPAVWLLPWVKIAGRVDHVRDGQAFLWLAGVGPAVLWLALEKLRRTNKSDRSEAANLALAWAFAFGSVYWFTAVQGTVWFAAHVVAVALAASFVLVSIDADRPMVAGMLLGLAFLTRPPMLLMGILFLGEAVRMSVGGVFPEARGGWLSHGWETLRAIRWPVLAKKLGLFVVPLAALLVVYLWYNRARFDHPFATGHEYLTVAWRARIEKWGLFSYHYLARNLGVMLTSLPWVSKNPWSMQINAHGLALWLTTPMYLWLLWPRKRGYQYFIYAASAIAVAIPDLLYQNTGWMQFGYRFSNDFAVLLFMLLALGGWRFGKAFWSAVVFAVMVNGFGAMTFDRQKFSRFYHVDGSQKTIYQPD